MANYFKPLKNILLILIIACCMFIQGCKYSIASLQEQIAIYQNMGFTKIDNPDNQTTLNNVILDINTLTEIENYLKNNNILCKIDTFFILYLQENADNITSLIYIYGFTDTKNAKVFYNHFNTAKTSTFYLYNNYVIQKGISKDIKNGAVNYNFYTKFCSGLKK